MKHTVQNIKFIVSKNAGEVSGILTLPHSPELFFIFAHGAGAGMKHAFMEKVSVALAEVNIGVLRYNFPYAEKNYKRPDPAPILLEAVSSACKVAREYVKNVPLFAGGKSMGGRMSSMAASDNMLSDLRGIIFFGFPLHAPGKPSDSRAEHLFSVKVPMLFLQGSRDKLADLKLLHPVITQLKDNATLHVIEGADHSFQMLKSAGRTNEEVITELAKKAKEWCRTIKPIE